MTLLHANVSTATITIGGESRAARFGRSGACKAAEKREGDGKTPLGIWPVRTLLLRPDRGLPAPATGLPWRWLRQSDGWSDDVADPAYNQPVRHPHSRSAEHLWRADHAYDVVIVLGYNDDPPVPGLGSAIFLHCEQPDGRPTEGCVAVARNALLGWLKLMEPASAVEISA